MDTIAAIRAPPVVKSDKKVFKWGLRGFQTVTYGVHMETNPPPPTTVPSLIDAARKEADRSKKWTATKAGMSETTFYRKLNGGPDFTVGEVARIAQALRVPAASLLPQDFFDQAC